VVEQGGRGTSFCIGHTKSYCLKQAPTSQDDAPRGEEKCGPGKRGTTLRLVWARPTDELEDKSLTPAGAKGDVPAAMAEPRRADSAVLGEEGQSAGRPVWREAAAPHREGGLRHLNAGTVAASCTREETTTIRRTPDTQPDQAQGQGRKAPPFGVRAFALDSPQDALRLREGQSAPSSRLTPDLVWSKIFNSAVRQVSDRLITTFARLEHRLPSKVLPENLYRSAYSVYDYLQESRGASPSGASSSRTADASLPGEVATTPAEVPQGVDDAAAMESSARDSGDLMVPREAESKKEQG